eukprot:c9474_g1_i1.p1 GENE.c9474_g1_i1~~c9474_g1_i1.p1  ORF type:complete len:404 (+),score=105.35 c9474_g1_i1:40-1212(+)
MDTHRSGFAIDEEIDENQRFVQTQISKTRQVLIQAKKMELSHLTQGMIFHFEELEHLVEAEAAPKPPEFLENAMNDIESVRTHVQHRREEVMEDFDSESSRKEAERSAEMATAESREREQDIEMKQLQLVTVTTLTNNFLRFLPAEFSPNEIDHIKEREKVTESLIGWYAGRKGKPFSQIDQVMVQVLDVIEHQKVEHARKYLEDATNMHQNNINELDLMTAFVALQRAHTQRDMNVAEIENAKSQSRRNDTFVDSGRGVYEAGTERLERVRLEQQSRALSIPYSGMTREQETNSADMSGNILEQQTDMGNDTDAEVWGDQGEQIVTRNDESDSGAKVAATVTSRLIENEYVMIEKVQSATAAPTPEPSFSCEETLRFLLRLLTFIFQRQ